MALQYVFVIEVRSNMAPLVIMIRVYGENNNFEYIFVFSVSVAQEWRKG